MVSRVHYLVVLLCVIMLIPGAALCSSTTSSKEAAKALAACEGETASELTELSLESLMSIQVTSVSKKEEARREAAAAVFVITKDDIRRSGATTIADALRLAPGLHVAESGSVLWAISSRGFNDLYANKMLITMDGRSVYTPLHAGVFWDLLDTVLEDIDRIEVIRVPGGTL